MAAVCKGIRPEQRQGIGSILESSSAAKGTGGSLRRTLSADTSPKKWLSQHVHSEKREFSSVPESLGQVAAEGSNKEPQGEGQFETWSAILSQKTMESSTSTPASYIHPLVKRSASSLSEKSLQICTESLGSETGLDSLSASDSLDCSPYQENEDEEEEKEDEKEIEPEDVRKELGAENNSCPIRQKSVARSFPPPLPSLSSHGGSRIYMRTQRKDGRLVIQAVQIPSQKYFHARRQGGRLLLTFINNPSEEKQEIVENNDDGEEDEKKEFLEQQSGVTFEGEEDETKFNQEEDNDNKGSGVQQLRVAQEETASQPMMVRRLGTILNRTVGGKHYKNPNPWDGKSREKREQRKPFNAYECMWKWNEHTLHVPTDKALPLKDEEFLLVRRCKEPRKLLLARHCIATS